MPVILSPITDPLNHPVYDASVKYEGQTLLLTKSMILHKQVAISSLDVKGIYIMSPNVRLEQKPSNRHLLEFTQVDIELRDATAEEFRSFTEDMMIHVFSNVKDSCSEELGRLQSKITIPRKPFRVYSSHDLFDEFGSEFEFGISNRERDLFWITDFKREFYDKEEPKRRGHYINYDLFYPEGYHEALSGGERDVEYEILIRKIQERKQHTDHFGPYLEYARKGLLQPSAGGGLGVERLIRFLTKRQHIRDITLFPRVVAESVLL